MLSEQNAVTKEYVAYTQARGDIGWITDSSNITSEILAWSVQGNSRFHCPNSISDILDVSFANVLAKATSESRLDDETYLAFPAEMASETVADQPTLDGIYGPEDEAFFPSVSLRRRSWMSSSCWMKCRCRDFPWMKLNDVQNGQDYPDVLEQR